MGSHFVSSVVHHVAVSIVTSKDGSHLEFAVLSSTLTRMFVLCLVQSHHVMEMIAPPDVGVLSLRSALSCMNENMGPLTCCGGNVHLHLNCL
jgi:hypothetical protein